MGMRIQFNHLAIEALITQTGEKVVRGMSDVMRRRAILIRDLARSYAPRDTGLLERNIDYVTIKDSNRRNSFLVYVDMDARRTGPRQGTLGDYAKTMERRLQPYGHGNFTLGPGSREKAAAGNDVGGKFFSRAVAEGTLLLKQELRAAARGTSFASESRKAYRPAAQTARSRTKKRKNKRNS